jgi:uncharacterized protein (DUF362 family)
MDVHTLPAADVPTRVLTLQDVSFADNLKYAKALVVELLEVRSNCEVIFFGCFKQTVGCIHRRQKMHAVYRARFPSYALRSR